MDRRSVLAGVCSAAFLSIVSGTAYILDCRFAGEGVDKCWMTGLPIMGLGGAVGGGFTIGYETLNPRLKRPEDS